MELTRLRWDKKKGMEAEMGKATTTKKKGEKKKDTEI
jgi:hypothetical protein